MILDGVLGGLHLLFFQEIVVSTRRVLDIRIIPVVCSLIFLCLVADKNNIALVYSSLVRAAVRSLLVVGLASADAGSSRCSAVLL